VLTQQERDLAVELLEASHRDVCDGICDLTPEQWTFRESADRWSVAECAEHIAMVESFVIGYLSADSEELSTSPKRDATVLKYVPDRGTRFTAPQFLVPQGRFKSPADAMMELKSVRDRSAEWFSKCDDPRSLARTHPALGALDGYQWTLSISCHARRHLDQISQIKEHPSFPR